jgi:hypothetical protein
MGAQLSVVSGSHPWAWAHASACRMISQVAAVELPGAVSPRRAHARLQERNLA